MQYLSYSGLNEYVEVSKSFENEKLLLKAIGFLKKLCYILQHVSSLSYNAIHLNHLYCLTF